MTISKAKTFSLALTTLIALLALSCGDHIVDYEQVTWEEDFGGPNYEEGYSVLEMPDGSLIVGGKSDITPHLLKIDACGNLLWETVVEVYSPDPPKLAVATPDGCFAAAGTVSYHTVGDDFYVAKVDGHGTTVWQKVYDLGGHDQARAITATDEGGFVVSGMTTPTDGDWIWKPFAIKIDAEGEIVWQKVYEYPTYSDYISATLRTSAGGYIVLGGPGCWVLRTNEHGSVLWRKRITPVPENYTCYAAASADNQRIAIVGTYEYIDYTGQIVGGSDAHLMVIDEEARLLYQQTINNSSDDWAYSVAVTRDGGFVLTGQTRVDDSEDISSRSVWLVRTNDRCTVKWSTTLAAGRGRAVAACHDGGIAIAGRCSNDEDGYQVYVAKTNPCGEIED